jgi:CHASE3 domain sensor protein
MDKLIEGFSTVLTQLGLAGVVIGGLVLLSYWLLQQWQASQNARIDEGKQAVAAILSTKEALDRLTEILRATKG